MTVITEQMCLEIEAIRDGYINQQVNRKVSRRDGNVTREQVEQWESVAEANWNLHYPSLAKLVSS